MKNIKRILALVIVAMMLVAIAIIPASAAEARRKPECDCGGNTKLVNSYQTDWTTYSTQNCTHYANGTDEHQRRRYVYRYRCESCGEYYNSYSSYSYRIVCYGSN